MSLILPPGVHQISAEQYHADPCATPSLSSTLARLIINQSPLHAWTACPRLNPHWEPVEKKTFDIGRAAHTAVLGRGNAFCAIPEDLLASNGAASTKAAKEWIEAARAEGLTPLKTAEVDQIAAMKAKISERLVALRIDLDPAHSEVVAIASIEGVMCRAMIDNAPADPRLPLYDMKTTTDASPGAVISEVERYGYDVQAAHYLDVWHAATGERRKMRFVFVEKEAPYELSVVELHDDPDSESDWMMTARSKTREARRIWGECLAADHWPGYPAQVAIVGARSFHLQRWADREVGRPVVKPKPSAAAIKASAEAQSPERKAS